MSDSYALRRRDTHRLSAWFAFGLIVLATLLALLLPRATSRDEVGSRGPTVRPQSNTRPTPPNVARTRGLAA